MTSPKANTNYIRCIETQCNSDSVANGDYIVDGIAPSNNADLVDKLSVAIWGA